MEGMRSQNQSLSFNALNALGARKGVSPLRSRRAFRTSEGEYTNLALLLSDQCPWGTVISVEGRERTLGGSVAAQVSAASWAVMTSRGVLPDRPGAAPPAISSAADAEILLNAACHRTCCVSDPIVVTIRNGSVTVGSPGGFFHGPAYGHRTRNPGLTDALDHLGFKNWSARGLDGVMHAYRSC